MELSIIAPGNAEAGKLEVSEKAFAREYNEDLVHQVVVAYQAAARQGTKAQKNRAAVSGGGKKPWRQKGTGRARAGTIRSPIWVGGGRAFAAQPRDYSQKVNKKMYRAGLQTILSELARSGRLKVVEQLEVDEPKTKALAAKLGEMNVDNALIVTEQMDRNLYLSARNIPCVDVVDCAAIDPVSLVSYKSVVMTVGAVKKFEERLG